MIQTRRYLDPLSVLLALLLLWGCSKRPEQTRDNRDSGCTKLRNSTCGQWRNARWRRFEHSTCVFRKCCSRSQHSRRLPTGVAATTGNTCRHADHRSSAAAAVECVSRAG